MNFNFMLNKM